MDKFEVIVCNKCGVYIEACKYPECIDYDLWNNFKEKCISKGGYRVILVDTDSINLEECKCNLPKIKKFASIKRQDLIEGLTKYFAEETDRFDDEADEEVKIIMEFLDDFYSRQQRQTELNF